VNTACLVGLASTEGTHSAEMEVQSTSAAKGHRAVVSPAGIVACFGSMSPVGWLLEL
jgi:hypothetical protein